MAEIDTGTRNRREFLQTGAAATAVAATASLASPSTAEAQQPRVLPRRPLGKTGVEVTILNQGTWKAPGALDRILRTAYAQGIRYFDTAHSYGSEPGFKRWFEAVPEVRKDIFLVTKDTPKSPRELLKQLDQRLEALGTDYIDLIFIHAVGDHGAHEIEWPKSREFKETAEAIRKSGKARLVGFSTHHDRRAEILNNAVAGGFVDAIMLKYSPWMSRDDAISRAMDACHEKGIGLISMKQMAGNTDEVFLRQPVLKEKNLNAYQGLLHACWTDPRIASCCVSMRNIEHIRENADSARRFEPLKKAELDTLREYLLAGKPMMCAECDGRCALAAGTRARFSDLTRFLTYHEHHGARAEARRQYARLSAEERDWHGADLAAAQAACPSRLDFARLLPEVDRLLA